MRALAESGFRRQVSLLSRAWALYLCVVQSPAARVSVRTPLTPVSPDPDLDPAWHRFGVGGDPLGSLLIVRYTERRLGQRARIRLNEACTSAPFASCRFDRRTTPTSGWSAKRVAGRARPHTAPACTFCLKICTKPIPHPTGLTRRRRPQGCRSRGRPFVL